MAADTTARDFEPKLAAIAFLGYQIDPGRPLPYGLNDPTPPDRSAMRT